MKNLDIKIKKLPQKSGVYLFKNNLGKVLYVGKAVNLKKRVKSYFSGHDNRPQVPKLLSEVTKIETKITDSEIEALLLEADLIKHLKPHFNVDLKDDKSFAYIYINFANNLPTVKIIRKKELDEGRVRIRKNDKLFGPFLKMYQVKLALQELRKIFPWCDKARTSEELAPR